VCYILAEGISEGREVNPPRHQSTRRLPIVLVIDDNPAIRDMVSWALELDGYESAQATNGLEALAWIDNAAREGRFPAVILLDLAMPGMDGNTFLERLVAQWEQTRPIPPIVVITAAHDTPDIPTAYIKGVVLKPFHVRDLLDVVHNLMT